MFKYLIVAAAAAVTLGNVPEGHAQARGSSPPKSAKATQTKPSTPPKLTKAQALSLEARGKAAQYKREAGQLDVAVKGAETKLALARQGEAALKARGRSARGATTERANLENQLSDLRMQRTRAQNAHSNALQAVNRANREQWGPASAYLNAANQARTGFVAPRARTVTYSASPPAETNRVAAAAGMRLGSIQARPLRPQE